MALLCLEIHTATVDVECQVIVNSLDSYPAREKAINILLYVNISVNKYEEFSLLHHVTVNNI